MNAPSLPSLRSKDDVLEALADAISISSSLEQKARSRYNAIGSWLDRENSTIKNLEPRLSAQGSFALGTVIRPVGDKDAYDVDVVCLLENGDTQRISQKELKRRVGVEISGYVTAFSMKNAAIDARRCWTLEYEDEAAFHMDILPCVPAHRAARRDSNSGHLYRSTEISITDKKQSDYDQQGAEWLISNPKGFVRWFRQRQATVLELRMQERMQAGAVFASIEDFPNHEVRTPLQDAIKLLKRHRDVMFDGDEHRPISIIISTLAAESYSGQATLSETLHGILPKMLRRIDDLGQVAVIANPSYPLENFADKWAEHPEKRRNFEKWIRQAWKDFSAYLVDARFNEIPDGLRLRMTETTISKIKPRMGLAISAIAAAKDSGLAEAALVKSEGRETKPWFSGD